MCCTEQDDFTGSQVDLSYKFVEPESRDWCLMLTVPSPTAGNHSCDANAEVTFPHNDFTLNVKALHDIKQGEVGSCSQLILFFYSLWFNNPTDLVKRRSN